ncbi:MAG: hypothetical protein QW569_07230 [Candidatus Bathyarchaeia archaeon]|nr:hypothetical protein [Candidatus Bathyarchaeota archaeon]
MAIVPVYAGLAPAFRPAMAVYPAALPSVIPAYTPLIDRFPALPSIPPYGWHDQAYWYRVAVAASNPGNFYIWPPDR